ncbi:unnamed protein product [Colias eurytheme]|nr:unnamed protein product [Colias eurytheme]
MRREEQIVPSEATFATYVTRRIPALASRVSVPRTPPGPAAPRRIPLGPAAPRDPARDNIKKSTCYSRCNEALAPAGRDSPVTAPVRSSSNSRWIYEPNEHQSEHSLLHSPPSALIVPECLYGCDLHSQPCRKKTSQENLDHF